jgi:hypothetical protein
VSSVCDNIRVCPEELGSNLAGAATVKAFTTHAALRPGSRIRSGVPVTSPAVAAETTGWQ